jgi:hypothetical protein
MAPGFVELYNRSLAVGQFSAVNNEAFITLALNKPVFGVAVSHSYQPVSEFCSDVK